ncbi:MAG: E3 binding domain-containing protein, partial [Acidobacteriota bacterium]
MITMTVNAEEAGRLAILVAEESTVEVGQVVATIDTDAAAQSATEAQAAEEPAGPTEEVAKGPRSSAPQAEKDGPSTSLSPAVRRLVAEHGIDVNGIEGTGKDGRILKADVLRFLEEEEDDAAPPDAQAPSASEDKAPEKPSPQPVEMPDRRQTREPMSRLRVRLAERLVEVQRTAAMLTTFNEADMSHVIELRKTYKERFKERHDVG